MIQLLMNKNIPGQRLRMHTLQWLECRRWKIPFFSSRLGRLNRDDP